MSPSFSHYRKRLRKRARNRCERDLHDSGWYAPQLRSGMEAVFIGGCGRSGTTLFKELMNRHSRCACGPETSLYGLPFNIENIAAPWGINLEHLEKMRMDSSSLIDFADRFAHEFLKHEGKERWVEKTPNNVRVINRLLSWYPEAKFIHVVRDGRDVMCSLRNHPKQRVVHGKIEPVHTVNPPAKSAARWLEDTMRGLAFKDHPRCIEVRYESLVNDPEAVIRRVCSFIGEDYEPAMLVPAEATSERAGQNLNNETASAPISSKSVGRWQQDLSRQEREVFIDIAGELLIALGYAKNHSWIDASEGVHDAK